MAYAYSPFADPIGFIVYLFLWGIGEDIPGTLLKLAILSSVIAFPFALLGKKIYEWVGTNVKTVHLVKLFLTSLITVFIFIIVVMLWGAAWGTGLPSVSMTDFLVWFVIAAVIAFIFAILGDFLNHILHQKWQVPQGMALYVIDLIVCFVFFLVAFAVYMVT